MLIKIAITVPPSHIKEDMKNEKKIIEAGKEMLADDKKALQKNAFVAPLLTTVAKTIGPTLASFAAGQVGNLAAKAITPTATKQVASNLIKSFV